MTGKEKQATEIARSDKDLVLASLERDQLTSLKELHIPRRRLSGLEMSVLWSLRIYLLFMIAVVLYQLVRGAR